MKFYLIHHPNDVKQTVRNDKHYCELLTDIWDDFGYVSYFTLFYINEKRQSTQIGSLKIVTTKGKYTWHHMENNGFERLDETFCSIGLSNSFYRKISKLSKDTYKDILISLRDGVWNNSIINEYKDRNAINDSLFRYSEPLNLYKYGYNKFFKKVSFTSGEYKFIYKFTPPFNEDQTVQIKFNFEKLDSLPNRINLLVGKNGVGKTSLLASFADALCGKSEKASDIFIPGEIPTFTKVMGISFSAFDNFRTPERIKENNRINNYIYCGIRDEEDKTLSLEEIKAKGTANILKIIERDSEEETSIYLDTWKSMLDNIEIPLEYLSEPGKIFRKPLSSGQCILISLVSEILSIIEDESILLFDEPEIHLHPNAISNFIRMLNLLLDKFNSYSICSTHSPLFVQEIPSRYIIKMIRTSNTINVSTPIIETFGENISAIVEEVFNVMDTESNYKNVLKSMSERMNIEGINEKFEKKLSQNALIYLYSIEDD